MAFFKGAAKEAQRAMQLQRQREKERRELELAKMRLESEMRIGEIKNKFSAHTGASYADQSLGASTVGLVTLDEMKRHQERMKRRAAQAVAGAAGSSGGIGGASAAKKACQEDPAQQRARGGLSFEFADDGEDEDVEEEEREEEAEAEEKEEEEDRDDKKEAEAVVVRSDEETGGQEDEAEVREEKQDAGKSAVRRFGKDPAVDTWFLPDRDREAEERQLREQLEQEWHDCQAKLKAEEMEVVYSYWDGSGHRRSVTVTKGNTIGQFLRRVLEQLRKEFQELRSISEDQLMFIKEDTILPHHMAFLDLITSKARGKSGPLYLFDVKQDVRLTVDTAMPSQETHAGKVCMRSWYDRNKHIFPACRWEPFDPTKNWDSLPASLKTANVINVK